MLDQSIIWVLFLIGLVFIGYFWRDGNRWRWLEKGIRRSAARKKEARPFGTFLTGTKTDLEFDALLQSLSPFVDDVQGNLVAGSLARRRGDIQEAIEIHRKLLEITPSLSLIWEQTTVELSKDYIVAGLYDRAEEVLRQFLSKDPSMKSIGLGMLVDIYVDEKNWLEALEAGKRLLDTDPSVCSQIAHFYCELAELSIFQDDIESGEAHIVNAEKYDFSNPRVMLLKSRLLVAAGQRVQARQLLADIRIRAPELSDETIKVFRESINDEKNDRRAYLNFILECIADLPSERIAECIEFCMNESDEPSETADRLMKQLISSGNEWNLILLLKSFKKVNLPLTTGHLELLIKDSKNLFGARMSFRCKECGMGSSSFTWLCPSCRAWGTSQVNSTIEPLN
tara:strand:+ start:787 stop:1977 length:1191 start_codon:yes stop_codon:yes gene_type:complete